MANKKIWYIFYCLVLASLFTPLWVFKELLFPYVTSKAFFFRMVVEAALPFYLYLVVTEKNLRPRLKHPLNLAVLLFLAINIITSFTGVNINRSLWGNFERMGGTFYLAHLVALFFYVQTIAQAASQTGGVYLKRFLQVFIALAALVSLNGISAWLGGPTLVMDAALPGRVSSTFGNPIFFASFLIIPLFLCIYLAVKEQDKNLKIAYLAAAVLQLFGILLSGTRGALVGLILGLFIGTIIYSVWTKNLLARKVSLFVLVLFVVIVAGLYSFHNKLPGNSTLYRIVNLNDSNTQSRLIQWKMAFNGVKEHPLLGVGPENYYVIFDKFYNPEIYKYDPSWFDKPHNFLLEVLVVNGVFGFIIYLGIFFLAIYGLRKAYKSDILGLLEVCILIAAIVAYQIQNLFVFDTVSASVAFYGFMGFLAYQWSPRQAPVPEFETQMPVKLPSKTLAVAILVVSCGIILVIGYISNIPSMEAAKRLNFGYGYTSYNAHTADGYFKSALAVHFNLDPRETANKYSDFSASLASSPPKDATPDFIAEIIDSATEVQKTVTLKTQNDPLLWLRLAIDEMNKALIHNGDVSSSQYAIDSALSLAPKRVELLQLYTQLGSYKKDWPLVVEYSQKISQYDPDNAEFKWQLAIAYYLNKQMEQAVRAGDEAIAQGMNFKKLQQFAWYVQYYQEKKDYTKIIPLLEQAVTLEPNEIGLYIDLAKAYAGVGDFQHAQLLAQQVAISDPSQAAVMDKFIKSLQKP